MTSIRQWVAWAEQKIAGVIINEGLHCGLCEVKQGPLTVTFRARLLRPTPANLKKMLSLGPTLGQVLQVESVRMADTARGILIELPSPQPQTPSGQYLGTYTRGLSVAIGLDQWRSPVTIDLRHHPTLLFVGPPRRGKTSAMKSVLYALANQNPPERLRYVIISQRRNDWAAFENARSCLGVVSDSAEAVQVMTWGAGRLLTQRSKRGRIGAAVVFVLDDLTNLLAQAPTLATPMGEIATMGGGVHLFLFIGTHHAGSKSGTGDSNLEASATARIVYKPSSTSSGARSAGVGKLGLERLSNHKGDCLLLLDGYPTRIATGHTDDRAILQLPAGNGVVAPWRVREQPEEQPEQPEIGQHNPEQSEIPLRDQPCVASRTLNVAGFHVEQTAEQLKEHNLAIDAARPPTPDEVAAIHDLHEIFPSIHKTVLAAYGHYNGKVRGYVIEALEGSKGEEKAMHEELPATIDLTTEAGRARLVKLQAMGLIQWPDPSTLLTETA